MTFATPGWDMSLLQAINGGLRGPVMDQFMPLMSRPAWVVATGAVLLLAALLRRDARLLLAVLLMAGTLGLSDLSCGVVKDHFGRLRPYQALANIRHPENDGFVQNPVDFRPTKDSGSSYPSAHAANTMSACAMAAMLWPRRKLWRMLWPAPLLTGLSRVYMGVHYPSDVLAGWLLGLIAALAVGALLTWAGPWARPWSARLLERFSLAGPAAQAVPGGTS